MEDVENKKQWFVLRDFKKWNAKKPSYKALPELGIRCFTPMRWVITTRKEVKKREYVPVIQSLLFAYANRETLDPIVAKDKSLQYQYKRGCGSATPMTVPDSDMERFIKAVNSDPQPVYYTVDELTPDMLGKKVIIKGGVLDGYEGKLLKMQGSKNKRLLIEIPGFIAAAVLVNPAYLQLP